MHLERGQDLGGEVDALAERYGGRVGLAAVLGDLDRRARRTWAPGRFVHRAWTWDAADRRDRRWWPQGVAVDPRCPRGLVVSWYASDGGSRVTFLDLDNRRYRHVTLVTPAGEPLKVHAGGLAWHGSYLHVAATRRGFWSGHLDDVLRTPDGYVLPVRLNHLFRTPEDVEPLRTSFLSLDLSHDVPALLVGEYGNARQTHRVVRVELDETGLPHQDVAEEDSGVVRAQGVARAGRDHVLTASHGPWALGSLWVGSPGALTERRYAVPMGPEDITYDPASDLLWMVTEHPRRRWVVAIRRTSLARR